MALVSPFFNLYTDFQRQAGDQPLGKEIVMPYSFRILLSVTAISSFVGAEAVPYGLGSWPENGRGNHRALVRVEQTASSAVQVRVPWRRWDSEFARRAVVVIDESTQQPVKNVAWYNVTKESGDVVFQPATVPGDYGIYYMPYTQPETQDNSWSGRYLPNVVTVDAEWLNRHGLHDPTPMPERVALPEDSTPPMVFFNKQPGGYVAGSDLMLYGFPKPFGENQYTVQYAVRFDNASGPCSTVTLLSQNERSRHSDGYVCAIHCRDGRIYLGINRKDNASGATLAWTEHGLPADWGPGHPGRVTARAEVLPDQTRITLVYEGSHQGKAIRHEQVVADDSPQRFITGGAPVFAMHPGDRASTTAVQIEALRILRDRDQQEIFTTSASNAAEKSPNFSTLPKARLISMQARDEFNRLYPMGVIATARETQELLEKHPGQQALFFSEDRTNPVMMTEEIPVTWAQEGPKRAVTGKAQPDEYYAFQIGVWAARAAIEDVRVAFSDLLDSSGNTVVKAGDFTCYNITGVDQFGKPFTKKFPVPQGQVRSLWCGVPIPPTAAGKLTGTITVTPRDGVAAKIAVELTVAGAKIANHGDNEPWRMSRIRWLNSTIGHDDSLIPPPYTPVAYEPQGNFFRVLGRRIHMDGDGLPSQIESFGREILSRPIRFEITAGGKALPWSAEPTRLIRRSASTVELETRSRADGLDLTVRTATDFDGSQTVEIALRAKGTVQLDDAALVVPVRAEVASFLTGLGYRANNCPDAWDWKWNPDYPNNNLWLGRIEAGLGLKMLPRTELWAVQPNVFKRSFKEGLFDSWHNEGNGGARVVRQQAPDGDGSVVVRIFTGAMALKANEEKRWRFRLFVTPFKPLRDDHWNHRYTWDGASSKPGMIVHYHHGNPYNPFINYPFIRAKEFKQEFARRQSLKQNATLYYTVGILSNHVPELLMFKSLGDEILASDTMVAGTGGVTINSAGGGYPWLREHLGSGYAPAWLCQISKGQLDTAVGTNGDSRLANYYVEGLNWLRKEVGPVGLYFDGIGYGRETMLRVMRILSRDNPDYIAVYHAGDGFANQYSSDRSSIVANALEHLPFFSQLMFGEFCDFSGPPGYWATELSGLPFGMDNQYHPAPADRDWVFREMLFGGTSSSGWATYGSVIRDFWDRWGMMGTKMYGWWDDRNPVTTDRKDVLATAYVKEGKTLIALASWSGEPVKVHLTFDWKRLGLDPQKARLVSYPLTFRGTTVPLHGKEVTIPLQPAQEFRPTDTIPIKPEWGWLLSLEAAH